MITSHYWQLTDTTERVSFKGKTLYNKYERVDRMLTSSVMSDHADGKITVAH